MPKITVQMVTGRDLKMIPYQIDSLKAQSFKDFEFVFVDELWEERKNLVKEQIGDSFPCIHILPKVIRPYFAPGEAWNYGFTLCNGELLYFMADYILLEKDCLLRHWETHTRFPKAFISGRCWEVDIPPEEFVQPNKVFHYRDYRLSLYEHGIFQWSKMEDNLYGSERAGVQNFWTGRNDSAPLEAILDCNGFDEEFDGAHGYHDEDLAQRMATLGLNYLIDLRALAFHFAHTPADRPQLRSDLEQHKMFKLGVIPDRIERGIFRANPHKNLIKEREKWKLLE